VPKVLVRITVLFLERQAGLKKNSLYTSTRSRKKKIPINSCRRQNSDEKRLPAHVRSLVQPLNTAGRKNKVAFPKVSLAGNNSTWTFTDVFFMYCGKGWVAVRYGPDEDQTAGRFLERETG
jgi:hypothetical protein